MEILGDRKYVELPGEAVHELPPLLVHEQPHLPTGEIQNSESHVARFCQGKRDRDVASSKGVGLALQKL